MKVQAYFLGEPRLIIEDREKLPGKNKLEALLFYLLYHEDIDRTEAASVFWPHKSEARAKSSLRNSLYEIRQLLGVDLFEASGRDRIRLSGDITLEKDVDRLLEADQAQAADDLTSLVFMQSKELKDNEAYETWLESMREAYQSIISNVLTGRLNEARNKGIGSEAAALAERLLALEPYNDHALRCLMGYYADSHRYNDALVRYMRFKKYLEEDLGVEPEPETVKLAEFILARKSQLEEKPREDFERSGLFLPMEDAYKRFMREGGAHILVYGDPGSGRTALIESFLETRSIPSVTLTLDFSNKALPEGFLAKWARAFRGSAQADFKKLLFDLPGEPMILVLRNVENIDAASLPYLEDVLSARQNRLFFILEATADFIQGGTTFACSVMNSDLTSVEVPLLTRAQLQDYLASHQRWGGRVYSETELDAIFRFSRGNLLLVNDYLKPQGSRESLFLRITAGLSRKERKLLDALTVYPDGFTPQMAASHIAREEDLMDTLRSLVAKRLLIEAEGRLVIKYPPLLQWLYDQLPVFYRVQLHEKAAQNSQTLKLTERLDAKYRALHWEKGGDVGKSLYYKLREVELTLDFYDQLYPAFVQLDDIPDNFTQSRKKYYELLDELSRAVERFSENSATQEAALLEIMVHYLNGRQTIAGGSREDGIEEIRTVIRMAAELHNYEYLLKGRIECIHYAIQKDDPENMGKYITLAQELVNEPALGFDQRKKAEVLRLEGLYCYNIGRYEDALQKLLQADAILKDAKYRKNGFLARAGILNYLGRTKEAMGDRQGADEAYVAAIDLVAGKVHKCLDILYADYGKFLWLNQEEAKAEVMLGKALTEYQVLGTHWKRPATEAISGLIALGSGRIREARSHLVNAQIYHKADRRGGEEELIDRLSRALAHQEDRKTE